LLIIRGLVLRSMLQIGLVGKPNTGKSTFFAAATLIDVKIAPYPFTTVDPNIGVGYVKFRCVCRDLSVKDQPRNSFCIEGWRFAPVELIDVAGLVPDAWKGRGLGNRFLDNLRQALVLIHVIDASGSTDSEGRPVKPGEHDPIEDVRFLEREIDMWLFQILKGDWEKIARSIDVMGKDTVKELYKRLSGLGFKEEDIESSLEELSLISKKLTAWTDEDIVSFIKFVRCKSKPILIAANKADIPVAEDNIKRLRKELGDRYKIIPTSAEAELALRKAAKMGAIRYIPGEDRFEVIGEVTSSQRKGLQYIEDNVLKKWGSTGVQEAVNVAVFELANMIAVYPVENENKYTDHEGRVLPDVFLVPKGTTVKELAYMIHTELGERFAFGIDARTKRRLSADFVIEHRSVIKVVTSR